MRRAAEQEMLDTQSAVGIEQRGGLSIIADNRDRRTGSCRPGPGPALRADDRCFETRRRHEGGCVSALDGSAVDIVASDKSEIKLI